MTRCDAKRLVCREWGDRLRMEVNMADRADEEPFTYRSGEPRPLGDILKIDRAMRELSEELTRRGAEPENSD